MMTLNFAFDLFIMCLIGSCMLHLGLLALLHRGVLLKLHRGFLDVVVAESRGATIAPAVAGAARLN